MNTLFGTENNDSQLPNENGYFDELNKETHLDIYLLLKIIDFSSDIESIKNFDGFLDTAMFFVNKVKPYNLNDCYYAFLSELILKIKESEEHRYLFNHLLDLLLTAPNETILNIIKHFLNFYENKIDEFLINKKHDDLLFNNLSFTSSSIDLINKTIEIDKSIFNILTLENKNLNDLKIIGYNHFSEGNENESSFFHHKDGYLKKKIRLLEYLLKDNSNFDIKKIKTSKNPKLNEIKKFDYVFFDNSIVEITESDFKLISFVSKINNSLYCIKNDTNTKKTAFDLSEIKSKLDFEKEKFYKVKYKFDNTNKYCKIVMSFVHKENDEVSRISKQYYLIEEVVKNRGFFPSDIIECLEANNSEKTFFIFMEEFFKNDICSLINIKKFLNLPPSYVLDEHFEYEKSRVVNTNFYNVLKENSFIKKLFDLNSNNYIYAIRGFFIPEQIPDCSDYSLIKGKLSLLFFDFLQDKYNPKDVFDFIDLFYIYSKYNKLDLQNVYFNISFFNELIHYLDFFILLNKKTKKDKDIKDIYKKIDSFRLSDLHRFLMNENNVIKNFIESMPNAYRKGFEDFLNEKTGHRSSKLFIFLEGYTSYLISNFLSEDDFKNIISFDNIDDNNKRKDITFGKLKDVFINIDKNEFLQKTGLTQQQFEILKNIIKQFHSFRNSIRGHGCFFNYHNKNLENLEKYFFDNIDRLTILNNDLSKIKLDNLFFYKNHYYNGEQTYFDNNDLILTIKSFEIKENYPEIRFFNYSNPEYKDFFDINISKYLFYLNSKDLNFFVINKLKKVYNKNLYYINFFNNKTSVNIDFTFYPENNRISNEIYFAIDDNDYDTIYESDINETYFPRIDDNDSVIYESDLVILSFVGNKAIKEYDFVNFFKYLGPYGLCNICENKNENFETVYFFYFKIKSNLSIFNKKNEGEIKSIIEKNISLIESCFFWENENNKIKINSILKKLPAITNRPFILKNN